MTGFGIVSCESQFFEENPNIGSNKKFKLKLAGGGSSIPAWSIFCQELICWEIPKRQPGSCLVTAPVPDLSFSTSFYLSDPACYVRTIGNRILIEIIKSDTQQNISPDQSRILMSIITRLFPRLEVRPDFAWQGESGKVERPIFRIGGMAEDLEVGLWMGEERIGGIGGEVKMVDRVYRVFFGQRARL